MAVQIGQTLKHWLNAVMQYKLIVLSLLALLVISYNNRLLIHGFLTQLELYHFNTVQASIQEDRSHTGIIIVGIDEESYGSRFIQEHFGRAPWRREMFGHLLRYLDQGRPKVIALDFMYHFGKDKDFPQSDAFFIDQVKTLKSPIISGIDVQLDPTPLIAIKRSPEQFAQYQFLMKKMALPVQQPLDKMPRFYREAGTILPLEGLIYSPMQFAPLSQAVKDRTQVIRRVRPYVLLDRKWLLPTFSLAIASAGNNLNAIAAQPALTKHKHQGKSRLAFEKQLPPIIRWFDKGNTKMHTTQWQKLGKQTGAYPEISLNRILQSALRQACAEPTVDPAIVHHCKSLAPDPHFKAVPSSLFRNKTVLVGTTSRTEDNSDRHNTIYGNNYPGIYVAAHIVDNYMTNSFVKQLDNWWTLGVSLLAFTIVLWVCLTWRSLIMVSVFALALGGAYSWLTFYLYQKHNYWINWIYPTLTIGLTFVTATAILYYLAERRKQQLRFAFGKYVSPGVMQTIEKNPEAVKLGGQRKTLTMMFCDIRGFTTFSENNPPEVVQSFLSQYFSKMNGIILNTYQGSINKLIGDAIMAYWGFPLETQDHALLAAKTSLAMKQAVDDWNASDGDHPRVGIGIGLNTGDAMIGNVGSEEFMDFTLIGDSVNIAARVESENKTYGTSILITEATYKLIQDAVLVNPKGQALLKGKSEPIALYELVGLVDPPLSVDEKPTKNKPKTEKPPKKVDQKIAKPTPSDTNPEAKPVEKPAPSFEQTKL